MTKRGIREFVAVTDELLYEQPQRITGPLVPYAADRPCHNWLRRRSTEPRSLQDPIQEPTLTRRRSDVEDRG
jgi:hypothetical protein